MNSKIFRKAPVTIVHFCFALCVIAGAQDRTPAPRAGLPSVLLAPQALAPGPPNPFFQFKLASPASTAGRLTKMASRSESAEGMRRITLEEAKRQATSADNPMVKLGQLQVEAAKQHRLGAQSDYFPKLSSTFTNFHFNKFMGEEIQVSRPIQGGTATVGLPLAGKDQTFVAVTAAQPVTPLFKLREVVRLAQADENIARAKAGMPVAETAANVEKQYYGLLVAQRRLLIAKAAAEDDRAKVLLASTANAALPDLTSNEIENTRAVALALNEVKELTVSLNLSLGFPMETELELVAPTMQFEDLSLKEVSDKAMATNPEVVEAEQTVVKARAGSRLSKLDYVPDFAILGGYAYNANALPLLPRDFSFIGIMGSYNLFDFGKREHTVKERSAQLSAAELALQLTKAKVAAAVKSSYFELDRSRQLSELAHRMASTLQLQRAGYALDDSELRLTKAKLELDMFEADLGYRQALAQVKRLTGEE